MSGFVQRHAIIVLHVGVGASHVRQKSGGAAEVFAPSATRDAAKGIATAADFQVQFSCDAFADNTCTIFFQAKCTTNVPQHFLGIASFALQAFLRSGLAVGHGYALAFLVELVPVVLHPTENELHVRLEHLSEFCGLSFNGCYEVQIGRR